MSRQYHLIVDILVHWSCRVQLTYTLGIIPTIVIIAMTHSKIFQKALKYFIFFVFYASFWG